MTQLSLNAWIDQREPPFWKFAGVIIWWGYGSWHDNDPLDDRCYSLYIDTANTPHRPPSFFRGWYA
jgi:hypothetical protein